MKWFQHQSDSYINLKIQELIEEFGMEGYGFFWICCELVAHQGQNYQIDNGKNWKKALINISKLSVDKIEKILFYMATINLIDEKSLTKNKLSIPKMAEYSDDYTNRVRRVYEHSSDNVRQDKSRLDKSRLKESSRFAPPSLQEITNYCLERKNGIDSNQFIDFYSSKGWFIGKNKMKDWKAAVRTWERRNNGVKTNMGDKYKGL